MVGALVEPRIKSLEWLVSIELLPEAGVISARSVSNIFCDGRIGGQWGWL